VIEVVIGVTEDAPRAWARNRRRMWTCCLVRLATGTVNYVLSHGQLLLTSTHANSRRLSRLIAHGSRVVN
jgi:hypothetical protein